MENRYKQSKIPSLPGNNHAVDTCLRERWSDERKNKSVIRNR